ncbi:hypothetical protein GCM10023340_20190 [Nocardioides marinquilinus]|uniref:Polysaccharide biosynthesis protein C-terminal domain-containing protein n=1 Tax=Nocardioides marinquilinus TaxID=1210400 RepID=A0ABP9PLV7_9ACTN
MVRRAREHGIPGGSPLLGTAATNVVMVVCSSLAGVIVARELGPSGRGDYAAVVVLFGSALIIGELGLTAAVTYFVARDPGSGADVVATGRALMVLTGSGWAVGGYFMAPLLVDGDDVIAAMRVMFVCCLPAFAGASFGFALQAVDIRRWNMMRLGLPVPYLLCVVAIAVMGKSNILVFCVALAATSTAQGLLSYWLGRSVGLAGGRVRRGLIRPLTTYGVSQLAASAPTSINSRADQLVLSQVAGSAVLGLYAVAVSVTALALPLVTAIGNVVFPRLASGEGSGQDTRRLQQTALVGSVLVAGVTLVPLCVTAPWLVPLVFGESFSGATQLVWVLAPGALALAVSAVAGDILRGLGRPLAVAWAQLAGAVLVTVLLIALVPVWGGMGAALASSATFVLVAVLLCLAVRGGRDRTGSLDAPDPARGGSR